jgi:hypothetical protein
VLAIAQLPDGDKGARNGVGSRHLKKSDCENFSSATLPITNLTLSYTELDQNFRYEKLAKQAQDTTGTLQANSTEQSPWEIECCSADQESQHFSWNPKLHYRVHKTSLPDITQSQFNPLNSRHPILKNAL